MIRYKCEEYVCMNMIEYVYSIKIHTHHIVIYHSMNSHLSTPTAYYSTSCFEARCCRRSSDCFWVIVTVAVNKVFKSAWLLSSDVFRCLPMSSDVFRCLPFRFCRVGQAFEPRRRATSGDGHWRWPWWGVCWTMLWWKFDSETQHVFKSETQHVFKRTCFNMFWQRANIWILPHCHTHVERLPSPKEKGNLVPFTWLEFSTDRRCEGKVGDWLSKVVAKAVADVESSRAGGWWEAWHIGGGSLKLALQLFNCIFFRLQRSWNWFKLQQSMALSYASKVQSGSKILSHLHLTRSQSGATWCYAV